MRIAKYILLFLIVAHNVFALDPEDLLFEDNFDNSPDWTVTQPTSSDNYCYDFVTGYECSSVLSGWGGYYNGKNLCDGVDGVPGNNNVYANQYAGYPDYTEAPHGGTGKCLTFWQESCSSLFAQSDGTLGALIDESPEVYLRFFFKVKDGFEYRIDASSSQKLVHLQSYIDGLPHQYFENNQGNQPVTSIGFNISYAYDFVKIYAETRCLETYYCHTQLIWPMGTISEAYADGGLLDGNWHCLEWRAKMNTSVGVSDGIMEFWFDGVKVNPLAGYPNDDIEWNDLEGEPLRNFKYITVGGNSNNYWDTSCSNVADCEQWYAIDDVVVATDYVGTDYVIGEAPTYDAPIVEILTESQTTTAATITIIGTLTTDPALTGTGVNVNGTTATADDGTWDEAVEAWTAVGVSLSLGANTITATGIDSDSATDTDTVSITRTAPLKTSTIRGAAVLKGAVIHQ